MKASLKFKTIWQFRQAEADFLQSRILGRSYNFFAGRSNIGDIRLDIDPSNQPTLLLDCTDRISIRQFFKAHGPCDTAIIDPPFTLWFKMARLQRMGPIIEICKNTTRRVIIFGGWRLFQYDDFLLESPPYCYVGPSGELKPIYILNRQSRNLPS